MKNVLLVGAGGHCRSILSILRSLDDYCPIAIFDNHAKHNEYIDGIKVCHFNEIFNNECKNIIIALGDNFKRHDWSKFFDPQVYFFPSIISPNAFIDSSAIIGKGCILANFAHIGPHTTVGDFSIINTNSLLEHESEVGSYSHLAPSSVVCGRSIIGSHCFLGARSVVIDNIKISNNTIIGAGSVVINSILAPNTILVGNPAKSK